MSASAAPDAKATLVPHVPESVAACLRSCPCVCFDVDSTIIQEEAIDALAAHMGVREGVCVADAVAALTARAMGGGMDFRSALEARLGIMRPSASICASFLAEHPFSLTPGVHALVQALRAKGTHVYLLSGGFTQFIGPVAEALGIPSSQVYANTLLFDASTGEYAGFDKDAPTSRDGGKRDVVAQLKEQYGYSCAIMIGDGATDLQARPPADYFIAYGGVALRENVARQADAFVTDWADLLACLR